MSKFQYKFESIKKTKDILEKKVQKELAAIDFEIEKLSDNYTELERMKEKTTDNLLLFNKVCDLKRIDQYRNDLKTKMEVITKQIEVCNVKREKKLNELIKKSKETKMFGILEETCREEYKYEENVKEEIVMNEIASQKFIREKN